MKNIFVLCLFALVFMARSSNDENFANKKPTLKQDSVVVIKNDSTKKSGKSFGQIIEDRKNLKAAIRRLVETDSVKAKEK